MSEHTPGPWEVQVESCECEPPCGCDNPYPYKILAKSRKVSPYKNNPDWKESAEIVDFMEVNVPLPVPEARANAHLIAAAPDLLEALEYIRANCFIYCDSSMDIDNTACELADKAIAKAKGGGE